MLAYLVAVQLSLPQAFWAVVTALIVVQMSVGGTVAAGIDRIVGTVGGSLVGAAVAQLRLGVGLSDVVAFALVIAPLSVLAAHQPRFRVAPLTAVIVLLASPPGVPPPLAAAHRVGEILLGSVIGLLVSLLIFPARAHGLLLARTAEALRLLAELAENYLRGAVGKIDRPAQDRLHERVRNLVASIEALSAEAQRERGSRLSEAPAPEPIVRSLRRLRSDVALLERATPEPLPAPLAARTEAALAPLARSLRALVEATAGRLAAGAEAPAPEATDAAIDAFMDAWQALQPALDGAIAEHPARKPLQALPFAIETLRRDLGDLLAVTSVLARPR